MKTLRIIGLLLSLILTCTPAMAKTEPGICERLLQQLGLLRERRVEAPTLSPQSIHEKLQGIEDFWRAEFAKRDWPFTELIYNIYSERVTTPYQEIRRELGPVYAFPEKSLYLDLQWFNDVAATVGPPSRANLLFTLAHEFGHHIQALLNVHMRAVKLSEELLPGNDAGRILYIRSRLEEQADCLAGIYFHRLLADRNVTDIEVKEAVLRAGFAGDDWISLKNGQPYEANTSVHGTAISRANAFIKGLNSGDFSQCEPFGRPLLRQD